MSSPHRIGPYEVVGVLGSGAMGTVFRARQPQLERDVAIKVLRPSCADEPDSERRFLREMKIAAALSHPNLVKVFDAGTTAAGLYLAMELVDGETLQARIRREPGGMPWRAALGLAARLADGIAHLHERGIVHRDIKPANVLITADGTPVLLDFGIARHESSTLLTQEGQVLGTPLFVPPEALTGGAASPAGDLWSLGCLLYELLGARLPWRAATMTELIRGIANAPIPAVHEQVGGVPPEVSMLVAELLERDVERRLDRATEVRDRCETMSAPAPAGRPSRRLPRPPAPRTRKYAIRGAVAVLAALAAVAVGDRCAPQRQAVPSPPRPSPAASPTPRGSGFAERVAALRSGGTEAARAAAPWLELGRELEQEGLSQDARTAYAWGLERLSDAELRDAPRALWAGVARALCATRRQVFTEEWLRRARGAGPRSRAAWLGLRDALERTDAPLFERACRAALEAEGSGTLAADVLGGHLHHRVGDVAAARAVWTAALAKDPGAERIREALAMLEIAQGELAAAERLLADVAPDDRHRVMLEYARGPATSAPRFANQASRRDDLFRMELFRLLETGDATGAQRLLDGRGALAPEQARRVAPELLAVGFRAPWLEESARAGLFARPPSWSVWSAAAGACTTPAAHARMSAWLAEAEAGGDGVARHARALWLARRGELSGALDALEKPAPGAPRVPALALCEAVARAVTSPTGALHDRARALARSVALDGPPHVAALAEALARLDRASAGAAALKVADRELEEPGWPLIAWMLAEGTDRATRERLAARVRAVVRLRSSGLWALRELAR